MPGASKGSGCGCPMPLMWLKGRTPAHTGSDMSALSSFGPPVRHLAETSDNVSDTTEVAVSSAVVGLRACYKAYCRLMPGAPHETSTGFTDIYKTMRGRTTRNGCLTIG